MKRRKKIPLRIPLTRLVVMESGDSYPVSRWSQGGVGYRKPAIWVQKIYEGDKDG